jgi:hypothetical protein
MIAPRTNPPPCKRCKETQFSETRMLDPVHNKRYVMFECTNCRRQTWTVIPDE